VSQTCSWSHLIVLLLYLLATMTMIWLCPTYVHWINKTNKNLYVAWRWVLARIIIHTQSYRFSPETENSLWLKGDKCHHITLTTGNHNWVKAHFRFATYVIFDFERGKGFTRLFRGVTLFVKCLFMWFKIYVCILPVDPNHPKLFCVLWALEYHFQTLSEQKN